MLSAGNNDISFANIDVGLTSETSERKIKMPQAYNRISIILVVATLNTISNFSSMTLLYSNGTMKQFL